MAGRLSSVANVVPSGKSSDSGGRVDRGMPVVAESGQSKSRMAGQGSLHRYCFEIVSLGCNLHNHPYDTDDYHYDTDGQT